MGKFEKMHNQLENACATWHLFDEYRCKVCGKKPGRHTFDLEELPTTGAKLNMLKYIMRKRLSVKLCVLCRPCVWSEFV